MKCWVIVVGVVLVCSFVTGQTDDELFTSDCPAPNGYFADAYQCDKYYHCSEGYLEEKLCSDGMAFNDFNPAVEKCDFIFQVDCKDRPELQPPRGTKNCPRANGYFPDADENVCNKFHFCTEGVGSTLQCPEGLAFSLKTGTCVWPEAAGRKNCQPEKLLNFTCPKEPINVASSHPRYPDKNDCQYFYVCINGEEPRRSGCKFGEVFNPKISACDAPKNVKNCTDYYTDYLNEYFASLERSGQKATPDIITAAINSGFTLPDSPRRVKIDPKSPPRKKPESEPRKPVPIQRRRRPQDEGSPFPGRRRPPFRRRRPTTTTTTTTTTPAPKSANYDYYYYDDYYDEVAPNAAAASA